MTEFRDIPFEMRTAEMVRAHYYELFPILRVHDELVRKHNRRPGSVNEPWTGGFSTVQIAELALAAVGRPARDHEDVLMAEQYIQHLRDEIATLYPQKDPDLAEAVICAEYQWAGCVTSAEELPADHGRGRGPSPQEGRGGHQRHGRCRTSIVRCGR